MSLAARGDWVAREIDPKTGLVVAEYRTKNILTTFGLTALASNPNQAYSLPIYLALENTYTTPSTAINVGATSIQLTARVDQTNDTQLCLGVGLGSQETVTFSAVSGTGPYTYTLSTACANAHPLTDPCCRQPTTNDTMTNVVGEQQYDPVNFANKRMNSPGGYSPGVGQWTMQWYFPAGSANCFIIMCGMCDSQTVGLGNLHNHFLLGVDHRNSGNDLEIDGTISIINA